uniref:PH domain-containing protein n=1 Tax=Spongospora subterranea TaxID=70186 RepID=A0A0H5QT01_9EUKA|eukprot:CRZ05153.1 hypothetical protein [Spongospora subterranea]
MGAIDKSDDFQPMHSTIHEGFLLKRGSKSPLWRKRFFRLTQDQLQWFKAKNDLRPHHSVSVFGCVASIAVGTPDKPWGFTMSSNSYERVYEFSADSMADITGWCNAINSLGKEDVPIVPAAPTDPIAVALLPQQLDGWRREHGLSPQKSQWRLPTCLAGISSSMIGDLELTHLPENFHLPQSTCMAVHNSSETLVFGSSTINSRINGEMQFITCTGYSKLESLRKCAQPDSCASLSWIDDRLVCGTGTGDVILYRIEDSRSLQRVPTPSATFSHKKYSTADTTSSRIPGSRPSSRRICSVRINPMDVDVFSSMENNRMHIWNFGRTESSIFSGKAATSAVFVAEWSPHQQSQLMTGGVNGAIKLFDTRQIVKSPDRAIAWKSPAVHTDSIRAISWSPLVRNWVATACDDSKIRIFDLRMSKDPVQILEGHTNAVRSIAWSNSHSEIILSGGLDGACRLWNLRLPPHYLMNTCDALDGTVIGCEFSPLHPSYYYTLTSEGSLHFAEMARDFFDTFVFHRFPESSPKELEIESLMYCRDLERAHAFVAERAAQLWTEQRYDQMAKLLQMCSETSFDSVLGESHSCIDDLVTKLSCYVSPFATLKTVASDKSTSIIQTLRTRLAIQNIIQSQQPLDLLNLEPDIFKLLSVNPDAFDSDQLNAVIQAIMPLDFLRALKITLRVAEIFREHSRFSDLITILLLFMSPTVFDPQPECLDFVTIPALFKKANVALDRDLRNPKIVIPQLELMFKVHTALAKPYAAATIIEVMEDQQASKIIPSSIHRLYFNALLQQEHYDKLYILGAQLCQQLEGYCFAQVILEFLEDAAFPKLSQFFTKGCMEDISSNEPSGIIAGSLTIVNMIQNCVILPEYLQESLPRYLTKLSMELENRLQSVPDHEAIAHATRVVDHLSQIRDSNRLSAVFAKNEIAQFFTMVKRQSSRGRIPAAKNS